MNTHLSDKAYEYRFTKRQLGRILVDGGFVSPADIEDALKEQAETSEIFGEILLKRSLVTEVELHACLAIQRELATYAGALRAAAGNPWQLSEVLLKIERIDPKSLDEAVAHQRQTSEHIGLILQKRGFLTENELKAIIELHKYQEEFEETGTPESKKRLCDILLKCGYISEQELDAAIEEHNNSGRRLERVLLESEYVKKEHYEHALEILRKIMLAAMIAFLSLAGIPADNTANAASRNTASIAVSAYVMPYLKLNTIAQSSELVVTYSDAIKGYVDAPQATIIEVKTNDRGGYLINFSGLAAPFDNAEITANDGSQVKLSSATAVMRQNSAGVSVPSQIAMSYRFYLDRNVVPGTYAWPINMTVSLSNQ